MKNDDTKMKPVIDLMWTVEDESSLRDKDALDIKSNCSGGCTIACCCSIPNVFTKFLCT